ncbi:hypothetical protein CYMTET_30172 [Cymbomonas tetramitiformis]|uniref:FACT complex subunit SSRP1 n=1 Tax=Cymbomonas tetramitiformis TaxID=36881 RepID=A0AAE0FK09_9CHLO|nr:hypothetical protein CYMTET_30172 [Cymbomonas tetramitiformis]
MGEQGTVHQFGNISLAGKGANNGQLKVHAGGVTWKRSGGKSVDIRRDDVQAVQWSKVAGGFQLIFRENKGGTYKFGGFRDQDLRQLKEFISSNFEKEVVERPVSVAGHNWGEAVIRGTALSFNPGQNASSSSTAPYAFEINLTDVAQATTQGKNKVLLEFHEDEKSGDKDSLVDLSFYVPQTSKLYTGTEETLAAQLFRERILEQADIGVSVDQAIASFSEITCLVPRLRLDIDISPTILKLTGTTQEFKIKHSSITRLFILPKPNPQTVVALRLDPPIRQGQTFYPFVLLQLLKGLKGEEGLKISKPKKYVSQQASQCVKCSYKADDGYLFPLESCFFYITKPPIFIAHDSVAEVEVLRQGGSLAMQSARTFDLKITCKDGEFTFHNIAKTEQNNLLAFISAKGMRVNNPTQGGGDGLDLSDDEDPGERRAKREAEEDESEDDDFVAEGSSDGGEPTDSSEDEEGNASGSQGGGGGSDGEEGGEQKKKKEKKRPAPKPEKSPAPKKAKAEKEATPAKGGKKPKRKKDKNAPKRALSAFMYFSTKMRPIIKEETPDIAFTEIGKLLGEKWKALAPEDKHEFDQLAADDKVRYEQDMKEYKAAQVAAAGAAAQAADADADADDADDED